MTHTPPYLFEVAAKAPGGYVRTTLLIQADTAADALVRALDDQFFAEQVAKGANRSPGKVVCTVTLLDRTGKPRYV